MVAALEYDSGTVGCRQGSLIMVGKETFTSLSLSLLILSVYDNVMWDGHSRWCTGAAPGQMAISTYDGTEYKVVHSNG